MSSSELDQLVSKNPNFETLSSGKLRCILTNHEITPDIEKYNEYINSKGYRKALEKDFDFNQYLPHIEPLKGQEKTFLWCNLTNTKLPRMKQIVLKHVQGGKYIRSKAAFEEKTKEIEERKRRKNLFKIRPSTKEESKEGKMDEEEKEEKGKTAGEDVIPEVKPKKAVVNSEKIKPTNQQKNKNVGISDKSKGIKKENKNQNQQNQLKKANISNKNNKKTAKNVQKKKN